MKSVTDRNVLRLQAHTERIYRVFHEEFGYIGNVQLTSGGWKFKAVGYDADGSLIPGGGPYTGYHNCVLNKPDARLLAQALLAEAD